MANYIQAGEAIDYTPGSAVAAGDVVVQGDLVGIATSPIAANELGALAVQGVFAMPKAVTAGSALSIGTTVYWDATNSIVTDDNGDGANVRVGKVVKAALYTDATVNVRLSN